MRYLIILFTILSVLCNCRETNAQGKVIRGKTETTQSKPSSPKQSVKPKETRGYLNGHEWVDLGLPSGTKWATCNVGASSPSDFGKHFAFGDITGVKYTGRVEDYPTGIIYGTTYDIAKKYMGENWRMPSLNECKELVMLCKSQIDTINGIEGRKIIGPNGNSIFLPFSGIAMNVDDIRNYSGATGVPWCNFESIYWSGESNNHYGHGISNNHSYLSNSYAVKYKYYGCSVRGVTK